jgi:hypothetical protein
MKIFVRRTHTIRPANYESVQLQAGAEIDTENEADAEYFAAGDMKDIGEMLSEDLDLLLDSDVDRALRSDGEHINKTHLWVFYEKD